jgi:N-acetyl-anhydromuramyl-L-alanine amidase AmpD
MEVVIHDAQNVLQHPTRRYATRAADSITHVVVHHSVARADAPPIAIARYHVGHNGWPGAGYHYYVLGDGTIFRFWPDTTLSYHAGRANGYSIGICLAGVLTHCAPPETQLDALAGLVRYLATLHGIDRANVKGHREMPGATTVCPGHAWLTDWKARLLQKAF